MSLRQTNRPVRRAEYWLVLGSLAFVAVCFYGVRAAAVLGLAAVTALTTDFVCLFLRGKSYKLVDLSNIGNALVLALLFPATVPYSIVILSTVFAVGVGTHVFGYRRDILFPPAAVGFLFAVTCWKDEVLMYPEFGKHLKLFGNDVTMVSSFTSQLMEKGTLRLTHTDFQDFLIGAVPGPMGTGCILMLVIGLAILIVRRQINFFGVFGGCLCIVFPILISHTGISVLGSNMILFSLIFFFGDPSVMTCRSLVAYVAAGISALFAGYLIAVFRIEYAPLAAIILTCPIWRALSPIKIQFNSRFREVEKP